MKSKKINLPTKKQIKDFWKYKVVEIKKDVFDSVEYIDSADFCFACGLVSSGTERAHILARSAGGSDMVDNLHLLCGACHKASEMLDGVEYFDWIKERSHVDSFLDMAYKVDYKFFRSFLSDAENEKQNGGFDVFSKSFRDEFNKYRRIEMKAEDILSKIESKKSNYCLQH